MQLGAQTIAKRDTDDRFRIATLQSELGQAVARHYGLDPADPKSWLMLADGHAKSSSDAIVAVGKRLGGVFKVLATVLGVFPRPLREALYRGIAASRYKVFGRKELCALPSPSCAANCWTFEAGAPLPLEAGQTERYFFKSSLKIFPEFAERFWPAEVPTQHDIVDEVWTPVQCLKNDACFAQNAWYNGFSLFWLGCGCFGRLRFRRGNGADGENPPGVDPQAGQGGAAVVAGMPGAGNGGQGAAR